MFMGPGVDYVNLLLNSLSLLRNCEATDPRDMVYGLLGLLTPHMSQTI
jgi:hypothetical protein